MVPSSPEIVRSVPLFAYPLAAAVMVTSLDGAGFTSASQTLLIVLAGLTLLVAGLSERALGFTATRSPLIWVLGLLGLLSILSAAWTVGSARDAARWGLVILAYGAIAVSSARLAARVGPWPIACGLALLAGIEAVLGIRAAALHALPDAEWFSGSWRPGGSFQYPPALGLLEVAALPALLSGLGRECVIAAPAAVGAVLAGAVLGSADSRLDVGLAAVVLLIWLFRRPASGQRRAEALVAAVLIAAAALASHLVIGRHVTETQSGGGAGRLVLIACLCVALAAGWLPIRNLVRARRGPQLAIAALLGLIAAVLVGAAAITPSTSPQAPAASQSYPLPVSVRARLHLWEAAVDTWTDRPVQGAGAGAYYQASVRHQGARPSRFAHNLPLELAAELGVLGLLAGLALYAATIDLFRRTRSRQALWLLGPAVAAFLVANLVDWPWHLAGLGAAWAVAAGGLLAAAER